MKTLYCSIFSMVCMFTSVVANATLIGFSGCVGANSCDVTITPPNPVLPNPNDGVLLGWDEVQNLTLTESLRVDRVFDESASFISDAGSGDFFIAAGTVVSSHYLQWDPGMGSAGRVQATIELDSQVFAFITDTQNLFDTDAALGLLGLNYNDFGLRGLEGGDTTVFNGPNTDINWSASSPGDWTRLITAFSPGAEDPPPEPEEDEDEGEEGPVTVPEPGALNLILLGLIGLSLTRKIGNKA